jgi:Na+/melibiose symporter-like transporter
MRPLLWLLGVYVAFSYRNYWAMAGSIILTLTNIPLAFQVSGYDVPDGIQYTASLLATLGVVFILAGMAWSARNTQEVTSVLRRIKKLEK